MNDTKLYYAVTRVRMQELGLLEKKDVEALLLSDSLEEAFSILKSHGWGDPSLPELDSHALLECETQKVWGLMEELIGEITPFDTFRHSHDYNNLKAAIKLTYNEISPNHAHRYFMPFGLVPTEDLLHAAKEHDFSSLPSPMDTVGREAYEALSHTGSGQNCDIIVDSAALQAIYNAGFESKNDIIEEYATLTVDVANIKTAIRAHKMGKGKDFLELAIPDVGGIDTHRLRQSAVQGREEIYSYLESTRYAAAVPELRVSMAAFERWCDNFLMEQIRKYRFAISGLEPLAAFVLARENEINMVRLILSAKVNQLDPSVIGERMRDMYV